MFSIRSATQQVTRMPVSRQVAPIALVLLTAASAGTRFWAARGMDVPWIAPDETVYALLGRSLWEDGSPSILGTTAASYSFVYPALIGLPLSLGNLETGVAVVQALGALLMSATAVIVYLWGRGPLGKWWAVAAAGLTLAVPDLAYSGLVMSEVAVFPIATLALWAIASALASPAPARQALAAGAIVLALATHVRLVALIPTLFVAVALQCGFARSLEPARRQAVLLAGFAGACAAILAGFAVAGRWHDVFGAYAAAAGGYEPRAAATDVFWHAAGVFVLVAGIPLVALAAMTMECIARRVRDPSACALVATTLAWISLLVLEVGTFASRWVGHLALRDLQPVVPPLMLVFALWIARGAPRPRPWIQLAGLAIAVPAVLLPVDRFAVQESALDAFSLIPLWRLAEATSASTLELAYALSVASLVVLAVFLPRRARVALPLVVGLALVSLSILSTRQIDRLTQLDRAWVFDTGDPRWIDRAAGGPVAYLQAGTAFSAGFWKQAFWNRRIDAVAYLPDAARLPPLAPTFVALQPSGLLRTRDGGGLQASLVVSPTEIQLFGEPVARAPRSTDTTGLTLWRAERPLRVSFVRSGVQPNGDINGSAHITVYACGSGSLELTLLGKTGGPVEIRADGILRARPFLAADSVWNGSVAAPPDADGRSPCTFDLVSRGLVGSTRLEFVRD
jgi:hypothetical protein